MIVLWILGSPLSIYHKKKGNDDQGASWIESIYEGMARREGVRFGICFPVNKREMICEKIDDITYYYVSRYKNNKRAKRQIISEYKGILENMKPDIIHIWGTEFPEVDLAYKAVVQLGLLDKVVLNLQGICRALTMHYYAGLPARVVHGYTLRDFLKKDNIRKQKQLFENRYDVEKELLSNIRYVIGRTDYDYAYSTIANYNIKYYTCNETIRRLFFDYRWEYKECVKHRIVMSQGYYPVKGVHFVIEALALIEKRYPDVELFIAGEDIMREGSIYGILKESSYARYLRRLIRFRKLEGRVKYVGRKNLKEMCELYLSGNVFVSSSVTENESNSLGEAKALGMPVIASFVGGVGNRIVHRVDGLAYQFDDPVILARLLCDIFDYPEASIEYGQRARENELKISDEKNNVDKMVEIYGDILKR